MSLSIGLDPAASSLFTAIGLTDADGRIVAGWFDDPIGAARRVLSDPVQRAALLSMLDDLLPAGDSAPGWHPLLDHEFGDVYLTVEGDVIGVAAALHNPTAGWTGPQIRGSVSLPLIDVAGELRPIAGSAEGPIRIGIELVFDDSGTSGSPVQAVSATLTIDVDRGAGVLVQLTGVDLGSGPVDVTVDSHDLGPDLVAAVRLLLHEALESMAGDGEQLARLADHLFELLGLGSDTIPDLPLDRMFADPAVVLDWFTDIADTPATLKAWGTQLAGLIGVNRPVTGEATAVEPLRAPLLALGPADLELLVGVDATGQELELGLAVTVATDIADLSASVTVLRIPLHTGSPGSTGAAARTTEVVPRAEVLLRAPGTGRLADGAPGLRVGAVQAGFRLDHGQVQPWLSLTEVILDGVDHGSVDLTDADAITGVVSAQLDGLLARAFGEDAPANRQARALLALLGLRPPSTDPASDHRLDLVALGRGPTAAIGALHRGILEDADEHPWSHMFAELAVLLGLPGEVTGAGTLADPWCVTIATAGPVRVSLAAWNALDAQTPPAEQRLRIGLLARAEVAPFTSRLLSELLAFDLPESGPGAVGLLGRQQLDLTFSPVGTVTTPIGLTAGAGAVVGTAGWRPGEPLRWQLQITDVTTRAGDEAYGPVTWTFPGFAPDLDLGRAAVGMLRLLLREALHAWGGDAGYVLGGLLGIHRGLPSLPADWPLIESPADGGLPELLADPAAALRDQLRRLVTQTSSTGAPFAVQALRILGALLRSWVAPAGTRPDVDVAITGSGRYADPWAIPLPAGADASADLLTWLEPAGPPSDWLSALARQAAGVVDGAGLAGLLQGLGAAWPDLDDLLTGRTIADLGPTLDALSHWLADGDGLVPLSAQVPTGATWSHGPTVAVPHARIPRDPAVIAQLAAQLSTWAAGGTTPVVLVAAPFGGREDWTELLATLAPTRPAGAHFDLRALPDPAEVDLSRVTAVAGHYTADLLAGSTRPEIDQLERVVRRVLALTGATSAVLVGHSTAGVVVRTLAARHPELVAGMATLGTPHITSTLEPLTDAGVADAVRVAAALVAPVADTALGATVRQLAALLDGAGGTLGGPIDPGWFTGVPAGLVDTVPGYAVGSALGGDLVGLLAGAAVAGAPGGAPPPSHLAIGFRTRLDLPPAPAGEIAVTAHARVDVARVRLSAGAEEPGHPATAASVELSVDRPGGWLVGDAVLDGGEPGPRIRRLDAGLLVRPGDPGAVSVEPWLRLVEASVGGQPARAATLEDMTVGELDAVLAALDAAAAGTAADGVLGLLRAAGLVLDTADGVRTSMADLAALVQSPWQTLGARRDELVAALTVALGLPPGPIVIPFGDLGMELSLDLVAGLLRLRTLADVDLAAPFAARLDAQFATASLTGTVTAAVVAGPVLLSADSTGTLSVSAPPWLDHLTLRPYDPGAVEHALTDLAPRVAVSAAVTALLGARVAATIGPIDALLRDPGGWLRRADALGTDGHLDGAKINALLETIAGALDLDATDGLGLPGGYLLSAAGTDPLRLSLTGTFGDAQVATITIDLAADLHQDGHVTPAGTLTAAVALPGDWGTVRIAFTVDSSGIGLVVTPDGGGVDPIRLLPTVDGLGALVAGATQLLPKLLQELAVWLRAQPGTHDVLDVVLEVATAFGIYADDAAGFTEPGRSARLRAMLQPGWLEHEVADSGPIVDAILGLFGPAPKITLPADHTISRDGDRLRWGMSVFAGCEVYAELGWGAGGVPQVVVGVTGLDTGPVTISEARLGFLDGVTGLVRLRVDAGGELDFFTPELELDVAGAGLSARILPLGVDAAADVEVRIVPTPAVVLTTEGAVALVGSWLVPLLTRFLLPEVADLLATPLWNGGPTPNEILTGAKLIKPPPSALAVNHPLPDLPTIALGALAAVLDEATVHLTPSLDLSAVTEGGRLGLRIRGDVTIPGDTVAVTIRFGSAPWLADPDAGITVYLLADAPGSMPPFAIEPSLSVVGFGAEFAGPSEDKPLIDGAVTVGGIGAMIFFDATFLDAGQFRLDVTHLGGAIDLDAAKIVLSSDDADSFVAKIVPKELQAPFSVAVAVRDGQVELHGGTGESQDGIELTFPLDLDLFGVIFLRELFLAAQVTGGRTEAMAAISANAELGPLAVAVTRVGLTAAFDSSGVQFAFKPPDGFGLSLDASVVSAGGFLLVDARHGRYVGAIEISVFKKFSLTAVGIVTTKHPDGTPGFSLLLLITVQLPVPIPLGYGFFFSGAGGLLGINRGMDVDRIRDGLRAGTADSILFPTDIIRRIDVIVRDLEESFPQADGRFLIAPMAFIQWMNPALVTLKIGLIIEIAPSPRIALLGVLRLALPTADEAVVDLKVAFLGSIDFAAGLLSFDASIYDSFIGYDDFKLSLEGDIAIRISWGSSPDLVASIGGFHPSYTPAASLNLPAMRRIRLSLLKDNPRLSLELYFAVTSNTIQLGARLEFFVGVSGFSISGDMGFDVLVQIAPFLIDAHMWAKLAVKAGGTDICSISLDLQLRGPTPWIARGKASFSILFFSVTVEVEASFGAEASTSLPSQPVLDRVLEALRDPLGWVAELAADALPVVTLIPPPAGTLVVDAAGLLTVRQSLIPLATDIALVGVAPPSDVSRISIAAVRLGTGAGAVSAEHEDVLAGFAPSTFAGAPTADADRLRAPAFEQRPTGVRVRSGAGLSSDAVVGHAVAYERIILDDDDAAAAAPAVRVTPPVNFGALVAGGAAGSSAAARRRSAGDERGRARAASPTEPLFAVTSLDRLEPVADDGSPATAGDGAGGWVPGALVPRSDAEARRTALSATGGRYQIVPEVQLVH